MPQSAVRTARTGRPARAVRRALAAAALLATFGVVAPAGAAPLRPQPCDQLAVSPDFARDGTAFCGGTTLDGWTPVGLSLFVSTDKGRTWRAARGLGLPWAPDDRMVDVVVSPLYGTDHAVFVSVLHEGVFASNDGGETFTPLIPRSWPALTPFVDNVGTADATRRVVLLASAWLGNKPYLIDPVTRSVQPLVGAPETAREIVVSPSWAADHTAVAFTQAGSQNTARVTAYSCTAVFDCSTKLTTFPAGYEYQRAWPAADFAKSKTVFAALRSGTGAKATRLYVSRNAGRTFAPMTAAQRLVDAHYPHPGQVDEPVVALATGAPGSDRVWMRIYGSPVASPPAAELYRSDDDGRTWVRVAYRRIAQHGGTMADLRVPSSPGLQPRNLLAATADNHVFVNGITAGGWGMSCSSDAGRTWGTFCR